MYGNGDIKTIYRWTDPWTGVIHENESLDEVKRLKDRATRIHDSQPYIEQKLRARLLAEKPLTKRYCEVIK